MRPFVAPEVFAPAIITPEVVTPTVFSARWWLPTQLLSYAAHGAAANKLGLATGRLELFDPLRELGGRFLLLLLALRFLCLQVLLEGRLARGAERERSELLGRHVTHGAGFDLLEAKG